MKANYSRISFSINLKYFKVQISAPRNLFGIIGTVARGNMHPAKTVYLEKQVVLIFEKVDWFGRS